MTTGSVDVPLLTHFFWTWYIAAAIRCGGYSTFVWLSMKYLTQLDFGAIQYPALLG